MGDDAVEFGRVGVYVVEMGGVHVPGHVGEQFDVVLGERAHDLRSVADGQFVEGVVLDDVRGQQVGPGARQAFEVRGAGAVV